MCLTPPINVGILLFALCLATRTTVIAQEPTLPVIWSAEHPRCCPYIAPSPSDQYVYYKDRNVIGCVDGASGALVDTIDVSNENDSIINMDVTYGMYHLKTRQQLVVVGDGISKNHDHARGMIQVYDVPQLRNTTSILLPVWWSQNNQLVNSGRTCISSDERYIAVCGSHEANRAYVYDLLTGELIWSYNAKSDENLGVAFTRDSNRVLMVTGTTGKSSRTYSCWDPISDKKVWEREVPNRFYGPFQFTDDGKRLVFNTDEPMLGVVTFPEFTSVYETNIGTADVFPSVDGKWLLLWSNKVLLVNTETQEVKTIEPTKWSVSPTNDWTKLYLGTNTTTRKLYKVASDQILSVPPNPVNQPVNVAPNPCSDVCQATFALASPSIVLVSVFDLAGREELKVFEGLLPAGQHVMDIRCSALPIGSHFVRVEMNGTIISKPLITTKGGVVR